MLLKINLSDSRGIVSSVLWELFTSNAELDIVAFSRNLNLVPEYLTHEGDNLECITSCDHFLEAFDFASVSTWQDSGVEYLSNMEPFTLNLKCPGL